MQKLSPSPISIFDGIYFQSSFSCTTTSPLARTAKLWKSQQKNRQIFQPKKLQNDSKKAYNCNQCSYTSNVSTNFNAHMLDHSGEKSFACRQCNYSTKTAGCLKLHLRTHSGEKHFSCTQCNYSSTQASLLKRHMMRNSGEKPFSCSL